MGLQGITATVLHIFLSIAFLGTLSVTGEYNVDSKWIKMNTHSRWNYQSNLFRKRNLSQCPGRENSIYSVKFNLNVSGSCCKQMIV